MGVRVLILCAGSQDKYRAGSDPLGIAKLHPVKQFLPVFGEPLLHRTLRQLDMLGVEPIVVSTPVFPLPEGTRRFVVDPGDARTTGLTLLATRGLWGEEGDQVVVLFGDTVYRTDTLRHIIECEASLRVYGWFVDQVGIVFREHERMAHHLRAAWESSKGTNYANKGLWLTYRSLCGLPLDRHTFDDDGVFIDIGEDFTRDFDYPQEYVDWVARHAPDQDPEYSPDPGPVDAAIIIRLCYTSRAVADPKRGFTWRFAWFRDQVLPAILAQSVNLFDIWVWVHPQHKEMVEALHPRVRTFTVESELPAYRATIPWAGVKGLPKYPIQIRIDSDDIMGPRFVETGLAVLRSMPARRALVHYQPYKYRVATGEVRSMRDYSTDRCSAFLMLRQPVDDPDYDWVYGRSHTKMASLADATQLLHGGHCLIACHDHNDSTTITSCGGEVVLPGAPQPPK